MALTNQTLEELVNLDKKGYLLGVNESYENFKDRVAALNKFKDDVDQKLESENKYELEGLLYTKEERLPEKVLLSCQNQSEPLYQFKLDYSPSFFSTRGLNVLFGGMAIIFDDTENRYKKDERFAIFQLRKNFINKKKYLIYSRDEIISHESCHVARAPFKSLEYEEYFAYQSSVSRFRRFFGPALWRGSDMVVMMLLLVFIFCAEAASIFYFQNILIYILSWVPFLVFLTFISLRSYFSRKRIKKVKSMLLPFARVPKDVEAILFRTSDNEIHEMSKSNDLKAYIKNKSDIRWEVIRKRFMNF